MKHKKDEGRGRRIAAGDAYVPGEYRGCAGDEAGVRGLAISGDDGGGLALAGESGKLLLSGDEE